jgi:GT2 family glycosyltransferase
MESVPETRVTAEDGPDTVESQARVTVVIPAHNAADAVTDLVQAIRCQQPIAGAKPEWMEVIFIDDASTDSTLERLQVELADAMVPFRVRVMHNADNLGLAASLNRALLTVETEYVLTCHQDCRFGSADYLANVVALLDRYPDVAVVSGQPMADVEGGLSRVEKVYFAANVMDIFPEESSELEPVGFAEGRCDGFRIRAVREAGFYDTALHHAGEDQVLAARMRAAGYRVCRAPSLRYYLSVSSHQDSLVKLVRHAQLFGRVHPYLLLANKGTIGGVAGATAGRNRVLRATLRAAQLAGAVSWLGLAVAVGTRRSTGPAVAALVGTNLVKSALFLRYVRDLRFDLRDVSALAALQPALDMAYAAGLVNGVWQLLRRGERTIS